MASRSSWDRATALTKPTACFLDVSVGTIADHKIARIDWQFPWRYAVIAA